ncbi:Peptidylglycine monooxygenase [Aphelenchoides bicaudatus]|nr:Peptidylglycine monooxygenase [Aphelenchoides bicaudatus]
MIRFVLLIALFFGAATSQQYYYAPGYLIDSELADYPQNPEQFAAAPEFSKDQEDQLNREVQAAQGEEATLFEEELRIPGEKPQTNDSYLCTAFKQQGKQKSIGIEMDVETWDCGEMANTQSNQPQQYVKGPPCASASAPIYAWSHGSGKEKTQLPEGVGFPIGGFSKNQYVVLQVHYMSALEKEDNAGVKIAFSNEILPKMAATLLLVTGGSVASHKTENFEAACVIDEPIEIHPISFRVHTHRHGVNVSGWLVREDQSGEDKWTLLGERSPQKPQIFEKIHNGAIIQQGDVIASKCTIKNNEDHLIEIGPTSEDEMCNFYLMYWSEGRTLSDNICYSPGAPYYKWGREAGLNHIPH